MPRGGPPKPVSSLLPAVPEVASSPEPGASTKPAPSPRHTALSKSGARIAPSRTQRAHARAKALDELALVGGRINTPPRPSDAISYVATFLVHATLPYRDPGSLEYWERTNGSLTILFEPGLGDPDAQGRRHRVGLPFGTYPRIISSWLCSEAVRTRSDVLSLGDSFTDWIRDGLHLQPTGGEKGTITRIRDTLYRMLKTKISVSSTDPNLARTIDLSIVPIEGKVSWLSPLGPDEHRHENLVLKLSPTFFKETLEHPMPFDERVQLELAKRHSCMAIDLYRLLTLRQYHLYMSRARTPELIPWETLAGLLGHSNAHTGDFKRAVADALAMLLPLYPGARTEARHGGLLVRPSEPHIPALPKRPLPLNITGASQTTTPLLLSAPTKPSRRR